MTKIQKVKMPVEYDPPQIHCPACGAGILGGDEDPQCEHMVIVTYPGGYGDNIVGEKYVEQFEAISGEIEETDDDLVEKFLEKHDRDSFLKFDVEFGGMTHSVEWYNITAIFDFAP